MSQRYDVAIVGGGIVGLAHAWMASRRGLSVAVFERTPAACGASIRNFGMIWPVGQPAGKLYQLAMRSRELWLELASEGVIEAQQCGSLHVAHHEDEWNVLQEFCRQQTHDVELIDADEVGRRSDLVNPTGLVGGMWSPTELRVDPRVASQQIAQWLRSRGVSLHFSTNIARIEGTELFSSKGDRWNAQRIIICSGSDLESLFPESLCDAGLRICKLQMLLSTSRAPLRRQQPHIASGLTLRHYTSFQSCPSLAALQTRIRNQTPELDRFGIHVMASAFPDGRVILGDSHEYDEAITPFDNVQIDDLMIRELKRVIRLESWTLKQRWHGIYAKHPRLPAIDLNVTESVRAFLGTGGAGMTLSFGLAEEAWKRWIGKLNE